MERGYELAERLICFASECIDIGEGLPKTFAGNHLAMQLIRSSIAPSLNYGEAQGAESKPDFIHKMKICLKELRETVNCLRLIQKKSWYSEKRLITTIKENNELIAIFVSSVKTAVKKVQNK